MSDIHYVYIIGHATPTTPEGPVKVGMTKSLGSRIAAIQTGNWRKIEVAHSFQLASRSLALEVEQLFHEALEEYRMAGEWFGIEPLDALETLCSIVFDVIEKRYPEEQRQAELVESGAVDSLKVITDFYWGGIPQ